MITQAFFPYKGKPIFDLFPILNELYNWCSMHRKRSILFYLAMCVINYQYYFFWRIHKELSSSTQFISFQYFDEIFLHMQRTPLSNIQDMRNFLTFEILRIFALHIEFESSIWIVLLKKSRKRRSLQFLEAHYTKMKRHSIQK